jgi:mono/diheme cytochrome c family protein
MSPQQLAVLIVAATLGLIVLLLVLYGRPRHSRQEAMPANFAKGDPDSVLEGPRLGKMLVWSLASTIFITAFLTIYFVVEPFRATAYGERFLEQSIARGEVEFTSADAANCAECHGPRGEGGFAATDTSWPAPPLNNIFARYTQTEIQRIVEAGRPGTPMPEWGLEFGGPLNEQKIEDLMNFMASIQIEDRYELSADITSGREIYELKCAVCHGDDATGQAMGQPMPTFVAPDLTTEFFRLGLQVERVRVTTEIRNRLLEAHADRTDPTAAEIQAALDELTDAQIIAAGEEASLTTIMRGRPNTPMPPWQDRLLPEQIDALMDYLRTIQRPEG